MHNNHLDDWTHEHVFSQDQQRAGEKRTLFIVILTAVMMVVEIAAGIAYGSMALLADGLHMASHTTALGIAVFAYVISRRLAADPRFAFGVGKINSLAGFSSAVMLLGFALIMLLESGDRLLNPHSIDFNQALVVALIGLLVNAVSAWVLLSTPHEHGHSHHQSALVDVAFAYDGHDNDHDHLHDDENHHDHNHNHSNQTADHRDHQPSHDHNLRAAYLHVLADALTSLLAIIALLAGKYWDALWLDPAMGIVGAVLITRWSYGLITQTASVLLDHQADASRLAAVRHALEGDSGDRVSDLHMWCIGHDMYAAEVAIVSDSPQAPAEYKSRLPAALQIVHITVEVHRCKDHHQAGTA